MTAACRLTQPCSFVSNSALGFGLSNHLWRVKRKQYLEGPVVNQNVHDLGWMLLPRNMLHFIVDIATRMARSTNREEENRVC
jgi:hypothetical protein